MRRFRRGIVVPSGEDMRSSSGDSACRDPARLHRHWQPESCLAPPFCQVRQSRRLLLTTARADILGYSSHRSTQDLYDFTARVFSEPEGLNGAETAVLLRTYKRVGLITGGVQ